MRTSRTKTVVALALAGAAVVIVRPAIGQKRPESILPPGFGEPAPAPTPRASSAPRPAAASPAAAPNPVASPAVPAASGAVVQPLPIDTPSPTPTPTPTPVDAETLAEYEMPLFARRPIGSVGAIGPREGGLPATAFGNADGAYLETLMRRLSAPLPSRWMSILLRRTLVSRVDTPHRLNGADFAAERAWLLLRMGEAASARAVVQGVDTANYTPKLYQVAMNALLATSDPGGLCPLADGGARATGEAGWTLAQAMCTALSGHAAQGGALITAARKHRVASGVDLRLAQKVVGAAGGGQAVTIEWDGVDTLNAWRFGLASATGVAIPDTLYAGVGPQVGYWRALSPTVPLAERIVPAEAAAGQGVLSSAALVDLYGQVADADDSTSAASATANDLNTAYSDRSVDARLNAIRQLWGTPGKSVAYPRLVLTARAAARLPMSSGRADADNLIASMLSAGLDRTAARWRGAVDARSDAWAMIALADPDASAVVSYGELASYAGDAAGDPALKQRMLFAGLAGLGRLSAGDVERAAQSLNVRIGAQNSWTRAMDRAAQGDQPATVVLLSAIAMQTGTWRGVSPEALYRIVGALRSVGLDGEARMIAAEAIARL